MYPMIGIPASVAATALSPAPSVNKNPRRDGGDGGRESWCPHIASGSSRPAWDRRPFRDEPGDDVRDLRRRQRAPGDLTAPVGHSEVRASRDHGMPDWRGQIAGRALSPAEISDVVAW